MAGNFWQVMLVITMVLPAFAAEQPLLTQPSSLHAKLRKVNDLLEDLLGTDFSHGMPKLSRLHDLYGHHCHEKLERRERIRFTLRKSEKEFPLTTKDRENLQELKEALASDHPLLTIWMKRHSIKQEDLNPLNTLIEEILNTKDPSRGEQEIFPLTAPLEGLNNQLPKSSLSPIFPQFAMGERLRPATITRKIYSLLQWCWKDAFLQHDIWFSETETFVSIPSYKYYLTQQHLFVVSAVTTAEKEIEKKAKAGNLYIGDVVKDMVESFDNLKDLHVHALFPIALVKGVVKHLALINLESSPAHGIFLKYYDSQLGYTNVGHSKSDIIEAFRAYWPEVEIKPDHFAWHQGLLNWSDCARYVASYIYLILKENKYPEQVQSKELEEVKYRLFQGEKQQVKSLPIHEVK